ncbi:MAG: response regulator [Alphaproteobacteria bacterium]
MSTANNIQDNNEYPAISALEKALHDIRHNMQESNKFTIFLVEDDADDRLLILKTLERSPYVHNVHCFENGDAMLAHFQREGYYSGKLMQNIPTLIMLDIRIPGSDGLQILKMLKENPLTKEIPIIMITGEVSGEKASEAWKLQANSFVGKPLHLDRVHEVMFSGKGWPKAREN